MRRACYPVAALGQSFVLGVMLSVPWTDAFASEFFSPRFAALHPPAAVSDPQPYDADSGRPGTGLRGGFHSLNPFRAPGIRRMRGQVLEVVNRRGRGLWLSGIGPAHGVLQVEIDGRAVGRALVGSDGKWRLRLTPGLSAGGHVIAVDTLGGAVVAETGAGPQERVRIWMPTDAGGDFEVRFAPTASERRDRAGRSTVAVARVVEGVSISDGRDSRSSAGWPTFHIGSVARFAQADWPARDASPESLDVQPDAPGFSEFVQWWLGQSNKVYQEQVVPRLSEGGLRVGASARPAMGTNREGVASFGFSSVESLRAWFERSRQIYGGEVVPRLSGEKALGGGFGAWVRFAGNGSGADGQLITDTAATLEAARRAADERARAEAERLAAEEARLRAEAETARMAEQERSEAEAARVAARERAAARAEADRLAAERAREAEERARLVEAARVRERAEEARLSADAAFAEAERRRQEEQERSVVEAEAQRLAEQRARAAREEAERAREERSAEERRRLANEERLKAERERLAREARTRAEEERRQEIARAASERAERQRVARELAEREHAGRAHAEREAAERARQATPEGRRYTNPVPGERSTDRSGRGNGAAAPRLPDIPVRRERPVRPDLPVRKVVRDRADDVGGRQPGDRVPSVPVRGADVIPRQVAIVEQPSPIRRPTETRRVMPVRLFQEGSPRHARISISRDAKGKRQRRSRYGRAARALLQCRSRAGRRIQPPGTYVVRRGDSLWRISRRHYRFGHRYRRIHSANRRRIRNPNLIYPCQRFHIPRKSKRWRP
jgi:colicin import membrane protein